MYQELIETLDLAYTPIRPLLERLEEEKFTGYIEVSIWNSKEYLLLYEGVLQRIIVMSGDVLEYVSPNRYNLPVSGTARLFRTDLFSLLNSVKNCSDIRTSGALCFAGYGEERELKIPLGNSSPTEIIEKAKSISLNGYVLFHTESSIMGLVLFIRGVPVGALSEGLTGPKALERIINASTTGWASAFALKENMVKLLAFLENATRIREGRLSALPQLRALEDDIGSRKITGLLVLERAGYERYYELFLKGNPLALIRHSLFDMRDVRHDEVSFEARFTFYAVRIKEPIGHLDIQAVETHSVGGRLSEDKVKGVKELFIEEMGPVGIPLWNKALKSLGYKEDSIPVDSFHDLIEKLAKEIPDEEYRKEFLKRARRFAP